MDEEGFGRVAGGWVGGLGVDDDLLGESEVGGGGDVGRAETVSMA